MSDGSPYRCVLDWLACVSCVSGLPSNPAGVYIVHMTRCTLNGCAPALACDPSSHRSDSCMVRTVGTTEMLSSELGQNRCCHLCSPASTFVKLCNPAPILVTHCNPAPILVTHCIPAPTLVTHCSTGVCVARCLQIATVSSLQRTSLQPHS